MAKCAICHSVDGHPLAHELGHYIVAKRHGFRLSLPYFYSISFCFWNIGRGDFIKIITSASKWTLGDGAAGPIAGFVASILAIGLGMPFTNMARLFELNQEEIAASTELAKRAWLDPFLNGWVYCQK